MFIRLFKYKFFKLIRTRDELFWSLFFPIILGTFFCVSFRDVTEKSEAFHVVDVAYIVEKSNMDQEFEKVVQVLSEEGENQLIRIATTSEDDAKELLKNGDIAGIIYNGKDIRLMVNGEGLEQSILNSFLDQYLEKKETITRIATTFPEKLPKILELENKDISVTKEVSFTTGSVDPMVNYFYALIAMGCLYGCFAGMSSATEMKANLSTLGARRVIAPTNKMIVILADFLATIVVQFGCNIVTLLYLVFVWKIDFGQKIPFITATILVGSIIGVSAGLFVGSIGQYAERSKMAIILAITMVECFLSGLMVQGMKNIVEHHMPILNRINPAALIVDAFYSLNIYDTYGRYFQNMASMLVIAVLLCVGSFLAIRRERYASL